MNAYGINITSTINVPTDINIDYMVLYSIVNLQNN